MTSPKKVFNCSFMANFTVKAHLKESLSLCGSQRASKLRVNHLIGEQCCVSGEQQEPIQTALTQALCNRGKLEELAEKNANVQIRKQPETIT